MENEWEREKQKILNALLGSGQDTIDFQPETEVRVFFYLFAHWVILHAFCLLSADFLHQM